MPRIIKIFDHPLIQHKMAILRDKNTTTQIFRSLISEITELMFYEATKKLKTVPVDIETPLATAHCQKLDGKTITVVPILRAGLAMMPAIQSILPTTKIGMLGIYRDEQTHEPVEYFCKLPNDLELRDLFVVDPMLATGGSAVDAIKQIKKHNPRSITFVCILAAPEGLNLLKNAFPDIDIFCGALDEKLTTDAYIFPGLGDAGDRIFGTVK